MEFTTTVNELSSAVTSAASVTPTKSASLVAYTGVNFTVKANKLLIAGSDGEVSVTIELPVTGAKNGTALLLPKQLIKWLSKAPKASLLTVSAAPSGKLKIELEGSNSPYTFNTMVATFPGQSATLTADKEIDLTNLAAALAATKDVAGEVTAGSGQTAIQLAFSKGNLCVNATDHIRITRASLPAANTEDVSVVIETKALEIVKNLKSTHVGFDKSYRTVVFSGENHKVTVRTLESQFAPVENILATSPPHKVRVLRSALSDAVERLACVADDSAPLVMEFDGSFLKMSSGSSAVGTGVEEVELESSSPIPTTIAANIFYIQQAARTSPNEELTISWSSPLNPLFIHSTGVIDLTSVVMPIRLSE